MSSTSTFHMQRAGAMKNSGDWPGVRRIIHKCFIRSCLRQKKYFIYFLFFISIFLIFLMEVELGHHHANTAQGQRISDSDNKENVYFKIWINLRLLIRTRLQDFSMFWIEAWRLREERVGVLLVIPSLVCIIPDSS